MKTLFINGTVVNVFTDKPERSDVLVEDGTVIGVGAYDSSDADMVCDVAGKYICPGFIDGHIHIESTMLLPSELARVCVPHGTTSIVADPHEIANVSGIAGIEFMLEASENIPLTVNFVLPSCVPATAFDESGAVLSAAALKPFYQNPRVVGLGEVMDYNGVISRHDDLMQKITDAKNAGKIINGHAPLLRGKALDRYISAGVNDDHEVSSVDEAKECISKGQWVMIRQGTSAQNLEALLPLFDEPYSRKCLLVTDDKHPADIISNGHIDSIIRLAVKAGKSPFAAIRMATVQAASCFGLRYTGAVAPGYRADFLILDNLASVSVKDVYIGGKKVAGDGEMLPFSDPEIADYIKSGVYGSFCMDELDASSFYIDPKCSECRVMNVAPGTLFTKASIMNIRWDIGNGIDTERDILKIAVAERHKRTGHIGIGFIRGFGLKRGAVASSVAHDSHNLIVIGADENDMAVCANRVRSIGGGCVVACDGKVIAEMPLPIGGLMSLLSAAEAAAQNETVRNAAHTLGVPENIEPFMLMAFMSLPVIPHLKITTKGLFDTDSKKIVSLFADDSM